MVASQLLRTATHSFIPAKFTLSKASCHLRISKQISTGMSFRRSSMFVLVKSVCGSLSSCAPSNTYTSLDWWTKHLGVLVHLPRTQKETSRIPIRASLVSKTASDTRSRVLNSTTEMLCYNGEEDNIQTKNN